MIVVEWRTKFSHLAPLPGLGMPEVVVVNNRERRRRKRYKLYCFLLVIFYIRCVW